MRAGSDLAASKASFAEMRCLQAVIDAGVPELHVPLMGVFRLHGHTVIASAWAPLAGQRTLVYGSCDGMATFEDRHASVVRPIVEELGQKLGAYRIGQRIMYSSFADTTCVYCIRLFVFDLYVFLLFLWLC